MTVSDEVVSTEVPKPTKMQGSLGEGKLRRCITLHNLRLFE